MKHCLIALISFLVIAGCTKDKPEFFREITYGFTDTMEGWTVMFSDYPAGQDSFYELKSGLVKLPLPLDTALNAVILSGNNHSDDLFTYMYKPVTGLAPNTTYTVTFIVNIASDIATGGEGAGGSPDLAFGVGGTDSIPMNITDGDGYYRPNFEVKLQSGQSNDIMQVAGHLGVTDTTTVYTTIQRHNMNKPMPIKTNGDGTMFLLVGYDSGFEGKTTIYIKMIDVRLEYKGE
jgi:hypothetical protein